MELNIYTIYDTAARAYNTPFFMQNHGLAIRAFSDQVNSQTENQIKNHPEQFILYHIGTYDDQYALIDLLDPATSLGKGIDFIEEDKEISDLKQLITDFKALIKSQEK